MKNAIARLQADLKDSLDNYCFSMEGGDEEKAMEEAYRAGDYLDALHVLRPRAQSRQDEQVLRNLRFLDAVLSGD